MLGVASSGTQGTVGAAELADRPVLRNGEILETVPGVIITQHAGGGKANQYFLRGFNLDHGSDIAIDLDGMPLNLPSHVHSPGYADMNIVIPELIDRVNFEKGPYYAADGDFSSAGAAHINFMETLPQSLTVLERGMYGYARALFANSTRLGSGNLVYGFEAYHDDGPWIHPDDYQRFNGMIMYSQGGNQGGFSLTVRGYHGEWNSSDQIAESAVSTRLVPFFGSLDNSDGGKSGRYSLQAEWHRMDEHSSTKIMAYAVYYHFNLFSDLTYFLVDTNKGDQFDQTDKRWAVGVNARQTFFSKWWKRDVENSFGLQVRSDWIANGLYQTEDRQRTTKVLNNPENPDVISDPTLLGRVLPEVTRQDDLNETSIGLYYENTVQWTEKLRSIGGVRGDVYSFNVRDVNPANSGDRLTGVASPKLSLVFGPWAQTEVYVSCGFGFHSDDARGTTANLNPDGSLATNLSGLFQTKGAEIGVRTLVVPHLQSTFQFGHFTATLNYCSKGIRARPLAPRSQVIATELSLPTITRPRSG